MDYENLKRLYDHLGKALHEIGCNHTTELTRKFLVKENISEDDIDEILHNYKLDGGYCDCEIYCNVLAPIFDEEI
jgi:hypothetical protein